MSTRTSSSLTGHATPMELRKPTTRTVAQRKVYGKRRNNAPRPVFDKNSPARAKPEPVYVNDVVEALQSKLAKVSINDEPVSEQQEPDTTSKADETEADDTTQHDLSAQLAYSLTITPKLINSSSETSSSEAPAPRQQSYETLVEVRICNKPAKTGSSKTREKEEDASAPERNTPKKKRSHPAERRSSGFVHDTKANAYVRPILNEALSSIASQSIQKFSTWASRSATMFQVAKLAEGSYGEVYKLHLRDEASRPPVSKSKLARLRAYGDGVFKIVPLCAQRGPRSKKFTSIAEIVSEVKMLKYLDPIPGFARFREIHVVQGRFPESFQSAWEHYKETNDDCWNPDPSSKKAYPDTQLWAIVEMDDAGCELEKFCWSSIFQIYDIFWGVAMALARAEEYAMFEHRDLHLGNVCIRSTRPDGKMDPPTELDIARQSSPSGFGYSGLETTIIDYSLSRAELRLADLPDHPEGIVEIASSDLDKRQIFDAIGEDEDEILLRDTYRFMRATLYTGIPTEITKTPAVPGIWADYVPRTNLVWLLFLLKNLLKNRRPEPTPPAPVPQRKALASCSPNTVMSPQAKGKASKAKGISQEDGLTKQRHAKEIQARVSQLQQTLEDRLKDVLDLLDLEHGHEDMCCAADLVAYAMDSEWLAKEDFF
ncbi:putative serine/threonine-protein kinase haspin [Penicillium rolfsii]|nr:putative serine/threonine-protein kinase haspin [Penicillium rolfsii]